MSEIFPFDRYEMEGAYHWAECDRRYVNWKRYNPALDARYEVTARTVASLGLNRTLLDVGCGDGMIMARVAPLVAQVRGVDSESAAIRCAKDKLRAFPNCEAIHATSMNLPFDDRSFEIVTSGDVIEHLANPTHNVREMCRVLKLNGALVLTTPHWRPDRKWDRHHVREYRAEELRALLVQHFRRVELTYYWPMNVVRFYETRLGWRLMKLLAIQVHNPFTRSSTSDPEKFGQLLAVCHGPKS